VYISQRSSSTGVGECAVFPPEAHRFRSLPFIHQQLRQLLHREFVFRIGFQMLLNTCFRFVMSFFSRYTRASHSADSASKDQPV